MSMFQKKLFLPILSVRGERFWGERPEVTFKQGFYCNIESTLNLLSNDILHAYIQKTLWFTNMRVWGI